MHMLKNRLEAKLWPQNIWRQRFGLVWLVFMTIHQKKKLKVTKTLTYQVTKRVFKLKFCERNVDAYITWQKRTDWWQSSEFCQKKNLLVNKSLPIPLSKNSATSRTWIFIKHGILFCICGFLIPLHIFLKILFELPCKVTEIMIFTPWKTST